MSKKAVIFFSRSFKTESQAKNFCPKSQKLSEKITNRISKNVLQSLKNLEFEKFWFSDVLISESLLEKFNFQENILQEGKDLREKIQNAFTLLFKKGFEEILILGNDTLLNSSEIRKAFAEQKDVLGKSADGGFYLLKIKKGSANFQVLSAENWREGKLKLGNFDFKFLKTKFDFDTLKDFLNFFPDLKFVKTILNEILKPIIFSLEKTTNRFSKTSRIFSNKSPPIFA
ncbi:MAG: DUF2064 domain-containing protein [Calditrichaeota bacterium]|nr:MAG: DUF2064 domain-containing protein [Calditrichota bacterium]